MRVRNSYRIILGLCSVLLFGAAVAQQSRQNAEPNTPPGGLRGGASQAMTRLERFLSPRTFFSRGHLVPCRTGTVEKTNFGWFSKDS